jgi:hypothetical protein
MGHFGRVDCELFRRAAFELSDAAKARLPFPCRSMMEYQ